MAKLKILFPLVLLFCSCSCNMFFQNKSEIVEIPSEYELISVLKNDSLGDKKSVVFGTVYDAHSGTLLTGGYVKFDSAKEQQVSLINEKGKFEIVLNLDSGQHSLQFTNAGNLPFIIDCNQFKEKHETEIVVRLGTSIVY